MMRPFEAIFDLRRLLLRWALVFLIIFLVSGAFSLFAIADIAVKISRSLFFVFLLLFVATMLWRFWLGRKIR